MRHFNKEQIARSFAKAKKTYQKSAIMQIEVGERLLSRLVDLQKRLGFSIETVLDLGCGNTVLTQVLKERLDINNVYALDFSQDVLFQAKSMQASQLNFICADIENLPFVNDMMDVVFSNMVIHWMTNLDQGFLEAQRVLKPEGRLLFSTLGPETFIELRQAWMGVDTDIHVHDFLEMGILGDKLKRAGFDDVVIDRELLIIEYDHIDTLLKDIKGTGAHNLDQRRFKGLTGKKRIVEMKAHYENFRNAKGKLPLTYEIIYGYACGKKTPQAQGEVFFSLDKIKRK